MSQLLNRGKAVARSVYHRFRPSTDEDGKNSRKKEPQYKAEKMQRIAPYLICPTCSGQLDDTKARCTDCGAKYTHTESCYNFLTPEHQEQFKILSTPNIASNEYDAVASAIVQDLSQGLILDCGAGCHSADYPNVIYYEVVDYPSTDVLGVGERLPFHDQTFDGIFSLNVLEHVSDPFRCAQELARVLKSNGKLYCVVPFLQPLHGYPNHFFNMSAQGLSHLFENNFQIIEHTVPLSGLPVWTLNWFLRSWADGLQGATQRQFLNLRVRDLIAREPPGYLDRDFVTKLPVEKNFELASTTMIIGKKK